MGGGVTDTSDSGQTSISGFFSYAHDDNDFHSLVPAVHLPRALSKPIKTTRVATVNCLSSFSLIIGWKELLDLNIRAVARKASADAACC